jgi:hypothetical protein
MQNAAQHNVLDGVRNRQPLSLFEKAAQRYTDFFEELFLA